MYLALNNLQTNQTNKEKYDERNTCQKSMSDKAVFTMTNLQELFSFNFVVIYFYYDITVQPAGHTL